MQFNLIFHFKLQFLLRIVDAQSRIMHAFADFNDDQASTFGNTMEHVLSHSQNILGLAEHFSVIFNNIIHAEISSNSSSIHALSPRRCGQSLASRRKHLASCSQ
jgi:hypothetical protein